MIIPQQPSAGVEVSRIKWKRVLRSVLVTTPQREVRALMRSLSGEGALLHMDQPPAEGTVVIIHKDGTRIRSMVTWVKANAFRVRFER
jgi:hypothetical protein